MESAGPEVMSTILKGRASAVNLVLDTDETTVPLFPDAGPEDTISCGTKGMTERYALDPHFFYGTAHHIHALFTQD